MSALRVLLRNSIDYAGLFPPAKLDMTAAVANYADYLAGDAAWALGRFILPVSRLPEFAAAAVRHLTRNPAAKPWQLSGLVGPDLAGDLDRVAEFNRRHTTPGAGTAGVDTIEVKVTSAGAIEETMHRIPSRLQVYMEMPINHDPGELIAATARLRGRAKVRTGGITRDAFPSTANLLRFVQACVRARVPFKATAGLHHPLRGDHRLTYAADSETSPMFGFLNLFLAAAFLRAGMDENNAARILEEASSQSFQVDERGISWRGHRLGRDALRGVREDVLVSFGSCSFTEPIEELQALHLLEPRVQQT